MSLQVTVIDTNGELLPVGPQGRAVHNQLRKPFYTPRVPCGDYITVASPSTAVALVDVYTAAGVLLASSVPLYADASRHTPGAAYFVPVAVVRAGLLLTDTLSAEPGQAIAPPRQPDVATLYGGGVFPIVRDATITDLYYHTLSAPGAATPSVIGVTGDVLTGHPTSATSFAGFTPANWTEVLIVQFDVYDGVPTRIQPIAKITSQIGIATYGVLLQAHMRIGVLAQPSAANPDAGATGPWTVGTFRLGLQRVYQRAWDTHPVTQTFGYKPQLS